MGDAEWWGYSAFWKMHSHFYEKNSADIYYGNRWNLERFVKNLRKKTGRGSWISGKLSFLTEMTAIYFSVQIKLLGRDTRGRGFLKRTEQASPNDFFGFLSVLTPPGRSQTWGAPNARCGSKLARILIFRGGQSHSWEGSGRSNLKSNFLTPKKI